MNSTDFLPILASIVALLIAIIGHEIMHGWVAYKYGDNTAKNAGRLSANPLVHIDPMGSIFVPLMTYYLPVLLFGTAGFLFGWAKPVPVNMQTVIRNGGYNAAIQVSLAGIAYNLFMATLFSIILTTMYTPETKDSFFILLAWSLVQINVVLAVLNILPIPGFDGSHFVSYVALKFKMYKVAEFFAKAEPYGMIVIIIILMTPLKIPLLVWPTQTLLQLLLS
ncbi:MAG: site-2 protease family protein [Campylobacterales bacterium]|nr:site-2 protease family protein [Campylobacterales bacterium]